MTKFVDELYFLYLAKPSSVCNVSGEDVYRLVANWPELGSCELASEQAQDLPIWVLREILTWVFWFCLAQATLSLVRPRTSESHLGSTRRFLSVTQFALYTPCGFQNGLVLNITGCYFGNSALSSDAVTRLSTYMVEL